MTGFGASSISSPLGEISVEIKSLNNRFLDLNIRSPRELFSAEPKFRDQVKRKLHRGKVDVFIRYVAASGSDSLYRIDKSLLRYYVEELADAMSDLGARPIHLPDPATLLQLPGVISPALATGAESPLVDEAMRTLNLSLDLLDDSRRVEGEALAAALKDHLANLRTYRREIGELKDDLLDDYRRRLKERMETLGKTLDAAMDPVRVETEIMLYADKSDITEELVRLDAHLAAFEKLLDPKLPEPAGKPLDFLVQELLRETNTIGNKARGVAVASRVVRMKSEIEKVREQVQNLE